MRFHELPRRLQLYILSYPLLLAPLLYAALQRPEPQDWRCVGALLFFTVVVSTLKVELRVFQGKITPTFAVVCLTQLLQGTQAAALCAAIGGLVITIVKTVPHGWGWRIRLQRPAPAMYRIFFNAANGALACLAASLVFDLLAQQAPGPGWRVVLGLAGFTTCYFLINTVGVSLAIAYQQQLSWFAVWQENFLWTAPGWLASASAAAAVQAAYSRMGPLALLELPFFYIIYYHYRAYVGHIQELNKLNQAIISSLATAIDVKDSYTSSHINRVRLYAAALGRAANLKGAERQAVETGALVHDIGKLGVPDRILGKPDKLSPEEFHQIQSHVPIGVEILAPVPFPFPVMDVVLTHHERWDGLGYPKGLKGEEIPITGRIIAIVDVFDALTSNRPYRRALSFEEALRVLREGAGKQFDLRLVGLFEQVLPQVRQEIERLEAEHAAAASPGVFPQEAPPSLRIARCAAELAAVSQVAHALAEQVTVGQVLDVVVKQAMALLPVDTAALYLKRGEEPQLLAAAVEGKYRERLLGMVISLGEGVAGWVAANNGARVNVSAALDIARRFTPDEPIELSAAAAAPLIQGPESLGALVLYTQAYSVLSEHHLRVLNLLAEHAAAAIQNLRRWGRNPELAFNDPLTGLANSHCLVNHLGRLVSSQAQTGKEGDGSFSVVMLDLDRFNEVNSQLGHLRGDYLLRLVGETLTRLAGPDDVLCRYAGDEFGVLLPGGRRAQAEQLAVRAREAIEALPALDGRVKVGASVGVASFPEDGRDGRELIQVAARRMYEEKLQRAGQSRPGGPGGSEQQPAGRMPISR